MKPARRLVAGFARLLRKREALFGINRRNVELVYTHNERRHFPLADDKLRCKELLEAQGVPVPITLAACDGLFAVDRVINAVAERGDFVVKPANGSRGNGILLVGKRVSGGGWRLSGGRHLSRGALRRHIADIVFGAYSNDLSDRALIEEKVDVDARLASLSEGGVADVRIIVLRGTPMLAMMRVPTLRSAGRANLHQGGVGVAIDLATGISYRARIAGHAVTHHPDNNAALIGVEIPRWTDAVNTARAAAAAVPLGYLGVDLLFDARRGPLVVEINARPGLEIQNVNGLCLGDAFGAEYGSNRR